MGAYLKRKNRNVNVLEAPFATWENEPRPSRRPSQALVFSQLDNLSIVSHLEKLTCIFFKFKYSL